MKKHNLRILALTMALCVSAALSGCAANAAAAQEPNKQTTTSSIPMEQAHNSGDTFPRIPPLRQRPMKAMK